MLSVLLVFGVVNTGENAWNCFWSKKWCGTFESLNTIQRHRDEKYFKIWIKNNPKTNELKETLKIRIEDDLKTKKQKQTKQYESCTKK